MHRRVNPCRVIDSGEPELLAKFSYSVGAAQTDFRAWPDNYVHYHFYFGRRHPFFFGAYWDEPYVYSYPVYPRSLDLIEPLTDSWPVQRLQWFTKNFYAASSINNDIMITDLRMGFEPEYVFRFKVGEMGNPHPQPVQVEQLPGIRSYERLYGVWARIWDPQARF